MTMFQFWSFMLVLLIIVVAILIFTTRKEEKSRIKTEVAPDGTIIKTGPVKDTDIEWELLHQQHEAFLRDKSIREPTQTLIRAIRNGDVNPAPISVGLYIDRVGYTFTKRDVKLKQCLRIEDYGSFSLQDWVVKGIVTERRGLKEFHWMTQEEAEAVYSAAERAYLYNEALNHKKLSEKARRESMKEFSSKIKENKQHESN